MTTVQRLWSTTALVGVGFASAFAWACWDGTWDGSSWDGSSWDAWDTPVQLARASGWLALVTLFATLTITPLARWIPVAKPWRRPLGISTAFAATLHAIASLLGALDGVWIAAWSWPYLRAGLVALVVLWLLALSSFASVIVALRIRLWKPLHRLVYVAAVLVWLHMVTSPWVNLRAVIAVAVILAVLFGLRSPTLRRPHTEKHRPT